MQIIDQAIASELNVSVEEYIEKIERTSYKNADIIIFNILSDNPLLNQKAKDLFNLIK
jgi:hypothetical protein